MQVYKMSDLKAITKKLAILKADLYKVSYIPRDEDIKHFMDEHLGLVRRLRKIGAIQTTNDAVVFTQLKMIDDACHKVMSDSGEISLLSIHKDNPDINRMIRDTYSTIYSPSQLNYITYVTVPEFLSELEVYVDVNKLVRRISNKVDAANDEDLSFAVREFSSMMEEYGLSEEDEIVKDIGLQMVKDVTTPIYSSFSNAPYPYRIFNDHREDFVREQQARLFEEEEKCGGKNEKTEMIEGFIEDYSKDPYEVLIENPPEF